MQALTDSCDDRVVHRRSGGFRLDVTTSHDGSPSQDARLRRHPFVLQFYGRPSTHLWEDEGGVVRGRAKPSIGGSSRDVAAQRETFRLLR